MVYAGIVGTMLFVVLFVTLLYVGCLQSVPVADMEDTQVTWQNGSISIQCAQLVAVAIVYQ